MIVALNLSMLHAHYEEVIAALTRNGIDVSIRYSKTKGLNEEAYEESLKSRGIEATVAVLPRPTWDPEVALRLRVRELVNVLRYEHAEYAECPWLRQRAFDEASAGVRRWARRIRRLGRRGAAAAERWLVSLDRALPPAEEAASVIASEQPDLVVVSPVVREPAQVEYLKAAARARIPTAVWVQSWDNLTNKGLLQFTPDRVFIWNETQREELAVYHGVPRERAVVTGAQSFDHWFEEDDVSNRDDFCRELGLDPARPFILYLGSSRQIAPSEPEFFRRWLAAIRASGDPVLESAGVLARPHPTMLHAWLARGFEREEGVAISPSTLGAAMNSAMFRDEYRHELRHCAVAVGVNTSGMIDAAIFGKPVCTVELPEFADRQHGTLHFRHLLAVGGGLLHTAPTLEEHAAQLGKLVRRDPDVRDERSEEFIREFVRPHGIDVPAARVFEREMLHLCGQQTVVAEPGLASRLLGWIVCRTALVTGAPLEEHPVQRIVAHVLASAIIAYARLRAAMKHLGVARRAPRVQRHRPDPAERAKATRRRRKKMRRLRRATVRLVIRVPRSYVGRIVRRPARYEVPGGGSADETSSARPSGIGLDPSAVDERRARI